MLVKLVDWDRAVLQCGDENPHPFFQSNAHDRVEQNSQAIPITER